MKPEERRLVDELFQRLDAVRTPVEDAGADTLIRRTLTERPALAYRLVQHAILQDVALGEARRRITDLESRPPGPSGGGLLGRLLGDVPASAPRPVAAGRRWGGADPRGMPYPAAPGGSAAGGFLRSAATTAAGVAAGGLLLNGLEHLFGGGGGGLGARPEEVVRNDTVINEYPDPAAGSDSGQDPGGWLQGAGADPLAGAADPSGWPGDPPGDALAGVADPGAWPGDTGLDGGGLLGDGGWDGFGPDGFGADDVDWS